MKTRVGTGYDVHRLVPERPLILCGTPVPYELGLLGHSDADVALHALMRFSALPERATSGFISPIQTTHTREQTAGCCSRR